MSRDAADGTLKAAVLKENKQKSLVVEGHLSLWNRFGTPPPHRSPFGSIPCEWKWWTFSYVPKLVSVRMKYNQHFRVRIIRWIADNWAIICIVLLCSIPKTLLSQPQLMNFPILTWLAETNNNKTERNKYIQQRFPHRHCQDIAPGVSLCPRSIIINRRETRGPDELGLIGPVPRRS